MNDEVIALNDSQVLRWIDELNGLTDGNERAIEIKSAIRRIKREPSSLQNRRAIKRLYEELDAVQFKTDYMHLVVDKNCDYIRACKGFTINDVEYVRLLGTSGGVKNSTIIFVSKRLAPEIRKRIDNGRNMEIEQIPAKFEAYRALTCSGSTPVSMPNGILVVPDCETQFIEDVIMLDDEGRDEPEMKFVKDYPVTLDASDGFGLILPSLAERWSNELRLGYVSSGFNTRCSWEKGMMFCFDFVEFANRVAGKHIVKDAWGHDVDITKVEMIMTTSMLKLWACYDSLEHYLACCEENHYTFAVTKTSPEFLDDYRSLNYQFIQSYNLTDEQIDELIMPTVNEIKDILVGDYRKAIAFMGGADTDWQCILDESKDCKALYLAMMANPKMYEDPMIKKALYDSIEQRINRAKIGVVDVHGNYSIASGDPYALCQSVFGLEVTGLLRAGEIYNKYWIDDGAQYVACFRAPMSCHNNIRKMRVSRSADAEYWYRYMGTITILNAWDTTTQALNGCDFDGDLIFTTDNRVLVENVRPTSTVYCVQRKAKKCIPTEDELIKANIASFGDDIGKTTNWITSMYDVQSKFDTSSKEYKTLEYRIICGQLFQQNAIDKIKGIACKPMPRSWHEYHANDLPDEYSDQDIDKRSFNLSILAEKKPYFMRYIYPDVKKEYDSYIKRSNAKCRMAFAMSVDDVLSVDDDELSDEMSEFIKYYRSKMPLSSLDGVMNRLCRRIEELLGVKFKREVISREFDSSILKSGGAYSPAQYRAAKVLCKQYISKLVEFARKRRNERMTDVNRMFEQNRASDMHLFQSACLEICSNAKQLCDIIVDICYSREGTKRFAWDMCQDEMLRNLIKDNGSVVNMIIRDDNGDIVLGSKKYREERVEVVV